METKAPITLGWFLLFYIKNICLLDVASWLASYKYHQLE